MLKRLMLIAGSVLALPILCLGALVGYLAWIGSVDLDLSSYRGLVARRVSALAGLDIQAKDALRLRLSSAAVGLEVEGLRVENPRAGAERLLFEARSLSAGVAVLPLLSGVVHPTRLSLHRARVNLARAPGGVASWEIGDDVSAGPSTDWPDLDIDAQVEIASGQVDYRDDDTGRHWRLRIERALARPLPGQAVIELRVEAALDEHPIRLSGRIGDPSTLLRGQEPFPVSLQGDLAGLRIGIDGTVVRPLAELATGVEVAAAAKIEAESLGGLEPVLGKAVLGYAPLQAHMKVRGDAEHFEVSELSARLGKARLDGNLKLKHTPGRPDLEGSLTVRGLDLRPLFSETKPASDNTASAGDRQGVWLSSEPLPFDWLASMDARIRVHAEEMRLPRQTLHALEADLVLEDRNLSLSVKGRSNAVRDLRLSQAIDGRRRPPRFATDLRAQGIDIGRLVAGTVAEEGVRGEAQLALQALRSRGASVRDIALALEGELLFLMKDGKADVRVLDTVVGGLSSLLGQLVARDRQLADLRCGLLELKFVRGTVKTQAIVDTDRSLVVVTGDIDLDKERLNLLAEPKGKGVTLGVATPIRIHGPLAAPKLELEKLAALGTLARLTGKIAVPSLILVDAFGDQVRENPCVSLSEPKTRGLAEGVVEDTAGAVLEGTGNLLKGAGKVFGFGSGTED
jgi:uncharacterized protein involved in outer membrane biogenesis